MLCPYCQEEIKDGAIKCKHCKSELKQAPNPRMQELRIGFSQIKLGLVASSLLLSICLCYYLITFVFKKDMGGGIALVVVGAITGCVWIYEYIKSGIPCTGFSGLIVSDDGITYVRPERNPRSFTIQFSNIKSYSFDANMFTLVLRDTTGIADVLRQRECPSKRMPDITPLYLPSLCNDGTLYFEYLYFFVRSKSWIISNLQQVLSQKVRPAADNEESTLVSSNEHP